MPNSNKSSSRGAGAWKLRMIDSLCLIGAEIGGKTKASNVYSFAPIFILPPFEPNPPFPTTYLLSGVFRVFALLLSSRLARLFGQKDWSWRSPASSALFASPLSLFGQDRTDGDRLNSSSSSSRSFLFYYSNGRNNGTDALNELTKDISKRSLHKVGHWSLLVEGKDSETAAVA